MSTCDTAYVDHALTPDLDALTGLRGIAASLIFVGHFFTNFSPEDEGASPLVTVEYFMPVTIFFVASGFTLSVIYLRGDGNLKEAEAFSSPGSMYAAAWCTCFNF